MGSLERAMGRKAKPKKHVSAQAKEAGQRRAMRFVALAREAKAREDPASLLTREDILNLKETQ